MLVRLVGFSTRPPPSVPTGSIYVDLHREPRLWAGSEVSAGLNPTGISSPKASVSESGADVFGRADAFMEPWLLCLDGVQELFGFFPTLGHLFMTSPSLSKHICTDAVFAQTPFCTYGGSYRFRVWFQNILLSLCFIHVFIKTCISHNSFSCGLWSIYLMRLPQRVQTARTSK